MRPNDREGYGPLPAHSGRQAVRLLGRLLTLALVLSLPLLLVLLVLHLVGYLPPPATRPRHAMVQYGDRDIRVAEPGRLREVGHGRGAPVLEMSPHHLRVG